MRKPKIKKLPFGGMINSGITGLAKSFGANDKLAGAIGSGIATATGFIPGFQDNLLQAGDFVGDISQYSKNQDIQNAGQIASMGSQVAGSFMKYGGVKYPYGGASMIPNAEVEKQEVIRTPNGGTVQVDGPSHENGGVPVNIPSGTEIYSEFKKTFAKLASKYKTDRQEKVINDKNSSSIAKETARLIQDLKHKKLTELFNTQEQLKMDKVNSYAKKMGITLPQKFNDIESNEHVNMSEQSESEYEMGGRHTLGYQDPRVVGGVDMTNPSSIQYYNKFGKYQNGGMYNGEFFETSEYESSENENLEEYKKGGIYIKPSHRGRFTAYKERTGKTTEEALHSPDPHVRQMANFARNAAKWKHEYGGIQLPKFQDGSTFYPINQDIFPTQPGIQGMQMANYNQENRPITSNQNITTGVETNGLTKLQSPQSQTERNFNMPDLSKYKSPATQIGMGLLQNAGNIYDLYKSGMGKKYDKVDYGQLIPEIPDYQQALRDADTRARVTEENIRSGSGGASGSYLASRIASQSGLIQDKARIREAGEARKAGIINETNARNQAIKQQQIESNLASKTRSEDIARLGVRGIGQNIAQQRKDYLSNQMDEETGQMMADAFKDPQFKQEFKDFLSKRKK